MSAMGARNKHEINFLRTFNEAKHSISSMKLTLRDGYELIFGTRTIYTYNHEPEVDKRSNKSQQECASSNC